MSEHVPERVEELARWLADYDQALEQGTTVAPAHSNHADLAPKERARLSAAEQCLQWIERIRTGAPHLFAAPDRQECSGTIGRFPIIRELGRGSYGIVLLSHDPLLDRPVALKVPHPEVVLSPELRGRFLREGKAVAALRHPNIVPVYEAGTVGPICYLALAYCPGPSLAQWLRQRGRPVDPPTAARLVRDLARAVDHAHRRHILHRDLKPGNVLLQGGPDGDDDTRLTPLVTDFGLAKLPQADGDPTQSGTCVGTPAYMAPEQAAGAVHQIGPATDIYALGAILYELLTGRRPFEESNPLATLRAIQFDPVPPPRQIFPEVPPPLEAICLKCLAKKPAERYATAADLAAELDGFLRGDVLAIAEPAPTSCEPKVRRVSARALRLVGAVGAAAVLAAVALAVLRPWNRPAASLEPPALSTKEGPEAAEPADLARRVAEWALRNGATVRIRLNQSSAILKSLNELPGDQSFTIEDITFLHSKSMDESGFADLKALPHPYKLNFIHTPLMDNQLARLSGARFHHLRLYGTAMTDDGLRRLSEFPNLRDLVLRENTFTDEGLRHVEPLTKLTKLTLMYGKFTDEGLRRLTGLKDLRWLELSYTEVTDAGLGTLAEFSSLERLDLRKTRVTDAGVWGLKAKLPQCAICWDSEYPDIQAAFIVLNRGGKVRAAVGERIDDITSPADFPPEPFTVREIDLRDTRHVTDADLDGLRPLRNLRTLHLGSLDHSEAELDFLMEMPSVQWLLLYNEQLGEADLAYLAQLDQLAILELRETPITDQQLADLRAAIPTCRVICRPP